MKVECREHGFSLELYAWPISFKPQCPSCAAAELERQVEAQATSIRTYQQALRKYEPILYEIQPPVEVEPGVLVAEYESPAQRISDLESRLAQAEAAAAAMLLAVEQVPHIGVCPKECREAHGRCAFNAALSPDAGRAKETKMKHNFTQSPDSGTLFPNPLEGAAKNIRELERERNALADEVEKLRARIVELEAEKAGGKYEVTGSKAQS